MTNDEKIDFIQNVIKWQEGFDVLNDKGYFNLNFDSKLHSIPGLKLSLDSDTHLNVGTLGLNSPSKYSIVVIGDKYLEQVDKVMGIVDKIAWMPYAVFLMAEKPGQDIQFTVSARENMSPTLYQVPASRSSVVQFVMTCPGMSHSSTFTLHMRDSGEVDDGKVWGDLCREKRVNILYNDDPPWFVVDDETGDMGNYKDHKTGKMVRIPRFADMGVEYSHIPHNWDILETFFKNNAIIPVWVNFGWHTWRDSVLIWESEVSGKPVNDTFDIIIVV